MYKHTHDVCVRVHINVHTYAHAHAHTQENTHARTHGLGFRVRAWVQGLGFRETWACRLVFQMCCECVANLL
jgi:hypothetical protein